MTMMMRGVVLCVLMGGAALQGFAQGTSSTVKDDLFAGTEMFAKGASDVTEITMDPDALGLVSGSNSHRAHSMVLNVVRTYSYDKPGMYKIEDVEQFRNKLTTGDWHCSVHTRSLKSGESTDVCNKRRTDDMSETAIITVEPKELTFIHTISKKGPGEQGEMGTMMIMRDMPGLSSLATIDPEAFVDIQMAKAKAGAGRYSGSYGGESYSGSYSGSAPGRSFTLRLKRSENNIQEQIDALNGQLSKMNDAEAKKPIEEKLKHLELQLEKMPRVTPDMPTTPVAPVAPTAPVSPEAPQ